MVIANTLFQSKHPLPTTQDSTYRHHQMVNTEIRLIIFFAAKDGEALYSMQKQDQELTVVQIMNFLLPNSAIPISDKLDLKIKIIRDNEGHYIMIRDHSKGEDITIVNIYGPNILAPQYIRQRLTDIKGEIDSSTVIVGDFNTPLTPMDSSSKQKIN